LSNEIACLPFIGTARLQRFSHVAVRDPAPRRAHALVADLAQPLVREVVAVAPCLAQDAAATQFVKGLQEAGFFAVVGTRQDGIVAFAS
jgi:hypothetical protein